MAAAASAMDLEVVPRMFGLLYRTRVPFPGSCIDPKRGKMASVSWRPTQHIGALTDPLSFYARLARHDLALLRPFPRHHRRTSLIYDPIEGYGTGCTKTTLDVTREYGRFCCSPLTTCLESGMDSGNKINCKTCLLSWNFFRRMQYR